MSIMATVLARLLSDEILFPLLQLCLVAFVLNATVRSITLAIRAGLGGATLSVKRGEQSMAIFYGTYAAVSGLLVAICLSVEVARIHRVFWVFADTILWWQVCLRNTWFRNELLGWSQNLAKLERR